MRKYLTYFIYACLLILISLPLKAQYEQETFSNETFLPIGDGNTAVIYPSIISVVGMPDHLAYIRIHLKQLEHRRSTSEFDILLEAPDGQRVMLLSDVAPGFGDLPDIFIDSDATSIATEDFSENNPYFLPTNEGPIDMMPLLDTIIQSNPTFAGLQNINPNGEWKLYIVDDSENDLGGSLSGWSITIGSTNGPVCLRPNDFPEITEVNRNQVELQWMDAMGQTWDLFYAPYDPEITPDYQTAPTLNNINGNTTTLENLDYDTKYQLYIRQDCSQNNQQVSRWQGPIFFETETGICAYAETVNICEPISFFQNASAYENAFFDPCNPIQEGVSIQRMYNFTPPIDGDYYFSYPPGAAISLSIRAQEVVDYCDSIGWRCLPTNDSGDLLLSQLEKDRTYKLLLSTYQNFEFQIGRCPLLRGVELDKYTPHALDVDFTFLSDGNPLVGNFELYYTKDGTTPTGATAPILSNIVLTDGTFSTPTGSLESATAYEGYIRTSCSNGSTCWAGPFDFKTDPNCGVIDDQELSIKTTATTAWIQLNTILTNRFYISYSDTLLDQPIYDSRGDFEHVSGSAGNMFLSRLNANTTYYFYLKISCSFLDLNSQAWQGPFSFQTNEDCFVTVENLYCEQCYINEIGPREVDKVPYYNIGNNDLFPADGATSCTNLRYDPRLERVFLYQAAETGTLELTRGLQGSCSSSEYLVQYYKKSATRPCDLEDWEYLGCWTHERSYYENISLEVEKDSSYYILLDYYGRYCGSTSPNTQLIVKGDNCQNLCKPVSNIQTTPKENGFQQITWDAVEGAVGYDIIIARADQDKTTFLQCTTKERLEFIGKVLHPDNNILLNIDSVLTAYNSPNTDFSIYVRPRCTLGNYSIWEEAKISFKVPEDLDQDGFTNATDCADNNAAINPDALEIPYDGLDNDCNALTYDDDLDQDGFLLAEDCDDNNAAINPDAVEIPNNEIDENCDQEDLITAVFDIADRSIKLFPNPTYKEVFITLEATENGQLILYDAVGVFLLQQSFKKATILDLGGYPAGIYFVAIQTNNGNLMEKLILL